MESTTNTIRGFKDKWTHHQRLAWDETLREGSEIQQWILTRNGFSSLAELREHLAGRRRILDAGCGNGRVTQLLRDATDPASTEIVAIDLASADVARSNLQGQPNVAIYTHDLLGDLTALGRFDFVYCQEVLHHTADPRRAFLNLAGALAASGEIAVYVYRKKAPVREFVDFFVHDRIKDLSYQEAMRICDQITALGRALAEIDAKVTVPDVDLLGIRGGEYDVQRFFYHFFMKAFWNRDLSFSDNAAVNYDWYFPDLSSHHTKDEVLGWFGEARLEIVHSVEDFYGITVRGVCTGAR
jgi:SAM-dependent methyltransferase